MTPWSPPVGTRFGRWTVVGPSYAKAPKRRFVPCRCDCGTERDVYADNVRSGKSTNCGCQRIERNLARATHGRAARGKRDPLYQVWVGIRRRCHDPKDARYKWYGGRGISVYEPWRTDAGAFITYIEAELGPRPEGMSLDRIDNDGDYAPGNLRWATASEQAYNRRPRVLGR